MLLVLYVDGFWKSGYFLQQQRRRINNLVDRHWCDLSIKLKKQHIGDKKGNMDMKTKFIYVHISFLSRILIIANVVVEWAVGG